MAWIHAIYNVITRDQLAIYRYKAWETPVPMLNLSSYMYDVGKDIFTKTTLLPWYALLKNKYDGY